MQLLENFVAVFHKLSGGTIPGVGLLNFQVGDNPAGVRIHHQHPGAHVDGLVHIVGDHDGQLLLFLPDAQDFVLHIHPGEGIQCAQRLVQQQYGRLVNQGAYQRHTLRHTAGQLAGVILPEVLQADGFDHLLHLVLVALQLALHFQGEGDVVIDRQPGEQGGLLEHHAPVGAGSLDGLAVEGDGAGGGLDQSGHQTENGGLAAAGGAHHADELAAFHGGGDAGKGMGHIVGFNFCKALGNIVQLQYGFFHYAFTPICQRSTRRLTASRVLVTTVKMIQITNRAANILS